MKKAMLSCVAVLLASSASASIIPTLVSTTANGMGGYTWTYRATLASDQALATGSYFTLYDIAGFSGVGATGNGFTASTQLLGVTPDNVLPNDSPSLINVTFTYAGPNVNFDGPFSERELGPFEIFSTSNTSSRSDFTSRALRNQGPSRGTFISTIGQNAVTVPGDGGGNGGVPEPATWGMLIAGFGMVGVGTRRRNRIAVTAA